jgi:putative transposase
LIFPDPAPRLIFRKPSRPSPDNRDMTAPRQILPGTTYLVTRRCAQRQFLLKPSALINQIVTYCLAFAADRAGIVIYGWVFMSNHWHAVVNDPDGRLPEFMARFNKLVGKCVNASLGRWESLWSSGSYSAVRLETEEDVMNKLVYVLANPVDACLVDSYKQWPGAISSPRECINKRKTIKRPDIFFRKDGSMPPVAYLEAKVPSCFDTLKPHQFAARLAAAVKAREAELREQHVKDGRTVLGRDAVIAQDPFDSPQSLEPRRKLNPRVACKDKWRRIEALGRLKAFLDAYREAWAAFKEGARDVVFPAGTYWMVHHAGMAGTPPE